MRPERRLTDLEPAGFLRRAGAFTLDLLVAGTALVLLLQLVLDPLRQALGPAWARFGWFYFGYALLTVSLPLWLYFAGYESSAAHATPGKRWLGITVASTSDAPVGFGRAMLRTIVRLLPFEIAHYALTVPANPFVDPITGSLVIPGLAGLDPGVLTGLLVALLVLGATLFTSIVHPDGRGPHDLLAHTFVVRTAAQPAGAREQAISPGAT